MWCVYCEELQRSIFWLNSIQINSILNSIVNKFHAKFHTINPTKVRQRRCARRLAPPPHPPCLLCVTSQTREFRATWKRSFQLPCTRSSMTRVSPVGWTARQWRWQPGAISLNAQQFHSFQLIKSLRSLGLRNHEIWWVDNHSFYVFLLRFSLHRQPDQQFVVLAGSWQLNELRS